MGKCWKVLTFLVKLGKHFSNSKNLTKCLKMGKKYPKIGWVTMCRNG